jgi:glycosyltransferase involved in cell wall biosynthesis
MMHFISALYNEINEVEDLINHVYSYVDGIRLVDDGSTDGTYERVLEYIEEQELENVEIKQIEHTGLPETVKNEALQLVPDGWVLMLDADERFAPSVLPTIFSWLNSPLNTITYSYVYFNQMEIIDGAHVRTFQKSKLFKKDAVTFSKGIHEDDVFTGEGLYRPDWVVYHRKGSNKQIQREKEYLETYKKLLEDGRIDEGRYNWLVNLHHYVKE